MNVTQAKQKYPNMTTNFLSYHGLVEAIPQHWKNILRTGNYKPLSNAERNKPYEIKINEKWVPIKAVRSNALYQDSIPTCKPAAQIRWEQENFTLEWNKVYKLPYSCTKSTRLQSLQYRVLNRYIPTRRYLFVRGIAEDQLCDRCGRIDTLSHFLYECTDVRTLWTHVGNKIREIYQMRDFQMDLKKALFGVVGGKAAMNLIILLTKQHIVACKLNTQYAEPSVAAFERKLSIHIAAEKKIAREKGNEEACRDKWKRLYIQNES